jgi:hypothetical protein
MPVIGFLRGDSCDVAEQFEKRHADVLWLFLGARARPPEADALLDWFEETAATLRSNLRSGTPMCCGTSTHFSISQM